MAYKMRFRVVIRGLAPQGADANAAIGDPILLNVGDTNTIQNADGSFANAPTGPIMTSLTQAIAAVVGVVRRLQSGLKYNCRFEVFGRPVGTPEIAENDIPEVLKNEQLYIAGDTPNPALLYYINRANRKPVEAGVDAQFIPADAIAEPYVGVIQGPVAP